MRLKLLDELLPAAAEESGTRQTSDHKSLSGISWVYNYGKVAADSATFSPSS